jgi:hypothetical protein
VAEGREQRELRAEFGMWKVENIRHRAWGVEQRAWSLTRGVND